jgi:hypothetical protein
MNLTERLNVLIQATSLSQKNGVLTLDEAVKAKNAIDVISAGKLDQNLPLAINALMEIAVSTQKRGGFSLKDAHMVYLAIDGIETVFQNEMNRLTSRTQPVVQQPIQKPQPTPQHVEKPQPVENVQNEQGEHIVVVPPKILTRKD